MSAKTIITFLVDGEPNGIKTIELSNWIGKAIMLPRAKLKESKIRPEMNQPAIYFLFGKDDNNEDLAYIGEAESLINRLANHDFNKDFWNIAIAFISKDNNLTKADVKYLEARCIKITKDANRYKLINSVEPIPNNLPEYQVSTMEEFIQNIEMLISSIGYPILSKIKINKDDIKKYFCKGPDADATGNFLSEGFLVLKGSKIRKQLAPATGKWVQNLQAKLLNEDIISTIDDGNSYILNKDYLFSSPSAAAQIVLGRSANGWTEWVDSNKKTLSDIERKI